MNCSCHDFQQNQCRGCDALDWESGIGLPPSGCNGPLNGFRTNRFRELRCAARHSRIRSVAFSVAVLLLAEAAKTPAAQLTLQTNTSAAAPLTISPWNSAGQLLVSVVNLVANDPASEWMTGWKISLVIVPDSSTHGSLQFAAGALPSPYVFDGLMNTGAPWSISNGVFTAFDEVFGAAAKIPTAPASNLQLISFTPSTDALGTFGIYAEPSTDTFWLDANNNTRTFVNVPGSTGLVRIGSVLVNALGDLNRDGKLTSADVPAMLSALADTHSYLASKSLTSQQWIQLADTNHDGLVNNADVQSLISMVANKATGAAAFNQATAAVVPEPGSLSLALLGFMSFLAWNRR